LQNASKGIPKDPSGNAANQHAGAKRHKKKQVQGFDLYFSYLCFLQGMLLIL